MGVRLLGRDAWLLEMGVRLLEMGAWLLEMGAYPVGRGVWLLGRDADLDKGPGQDIADTLLGAYCEVVAGVSVSFSIFLDEHQVRLRRCQKLCVS